MKFVINKHKWEIINIPNDKMQEMYKQITGITDAFAYGLTQYSRQKIYINKDLNPEQIIATLKHELAHCYLWTYGFREVDYNQEIVCDIVANSNEFINEIVKRYGGNKMACKKKGGRRK